MLVEDSKGECNFGQHEVNFRYQEALRMADDHVVYRNGAKEIAYLHGKALTFMPKYDEREGNSCHIHLSLWEGASSLFPAAGGHGMSETFRHFIAGLVRHTRELTLLLAPNVNSYKRFVRGSFAPDGARLGARQPHLRAARRRPRPGHARREPRGRRRRRTRTWPSRRCSRPAWPASTGSTSSRPPWEGSGYEAARRSRTCPRRCTRRATSSPARRWRARRSATRSSTTT